ncbi:thiamine pyrophosphate-dependent enzyme [Streptomyces griseoincarnatus]|uniref:thiamine pyrophosphate-dependent enzyme n=2 Tax=Streptomyces TaxID=1883 RepID=UPI0031F9B0E3
MGDAGRPAAKCLSHASAADNRALTDLCPHLAGPSRLPSSGRPPVKVVVLDNGTLSFVELEMKAGGILNYGTDLDDLDSAAVARAAGIVGVRAGRAGELDDALREAFVHDGPAVVDARTASQELSLPPRLTCDGVKASRCSPRARCCRARGTRCWNRRRPTCTNYRCCTESCSCRPRRRLLMRRASRPPGGDRHGRPCTGRAGRRRRAGPARRYGSR